MLIAGVLVFNACKKASNDIPPATSTPVLATDINTTATENARAEQDFSDVFSASEDAIQTKGLNKIAQVSAIINGCATVSFDSGTTISPTQWPKKITIDFGTTGCIGNDLRTRKGKIHISLTDNYRKNGTVVTITLENYYVNDYHVEGTKTVNGKGSAGDANGNYYEYDITETGTITAPGATTSCTWNSTRTRKTYIDKNGAVTFYLISGTANGNNSNGKPYTITIASTNPLKIVPGCYWITQGSISIVPDNVVANTITLNYGDGTCDDNAVVTYLGKDYAVQLN